MIEAKFGDLFAAYVSFVEVTEGIRKLPSGAKIAFSQMQVDSLRLAVERVLHTCETHGLSLTKTAADRLADTIALFDAAKPGTDGLHRLAAGSEREILVQVEEVSRRLQDQLNERLFVEISSASAELYRQSSPPFGPKVDACFPSARFDISEAGKCYSLGRYTASVMHLMRAVEVAVRITAAQFQGIPSDKYGEQLLNQIARAVNSMNAQTQGATWKADQEFYSDAVSQFKLFKNAYRNAAMHGNKEKYTEEEAHSVYNGVKRFFEIISERLSENP